MYTFPNYAITWYNKRHSKNEFLRMEYEWKRRKVWVHPDSSYSLFLEFFVEEVCIADDINPDIS